MTREQLRALQLEAPDKNLPLMILPLITLESRPEEINDFLSNIPQWSIAEARRGFGHLHILTINQPMPPDNQLECDPKIITGNSRRIYEACLRSGQNPTIKIRPDLSGYDMYVSW